MYKNRLIDMCMSMYNNSQEIQKKRSIKYKMTGHSQSRWRIKTNQDNVEGFRFNNGVLTLDGKTDLLTDLLPGKQD